jgi:hypothetical protein
MSGHKKKRIESIYNVCTDKMMSFRIPADSSGMIFAACLKPEHIGGLNLQY